MKTFIVHNPKTNENNGFDSVKSANAYFRTGLNRPSFNRFKRWANENDLVVKTDEPEATEIRVKAPEAPKTTTEEVVEAPKNDDEKFALAMKLVEMLEEAKPKAEGDFVTKEKFEEAFHNTGALIGQVAESVNKRFDSIDNLNEARDEAMKIISRSVQNLEEKVESNQAKVVEIKLPEMEKPKKVEGAHKNFDELLSCLVADIPVYMVGAAGSFKTSSAHKAAEALNLDFYPMSVGAQTTKSDLLGYMNANGEYVTSIFRRAYENGGVFLMDEIDAGNPNTITILNAALANGYMSFPDGVIERHKDFKCIAAANTFGTGSNRMYVGRNQLDAATLDRFAFISWDYDDKLEKAIAPNKAWFDVVAKYRKAANKLNLKVVISPRATFYGAKLIATGMTEDRAKEMLIFKGMSESDKSKLEEAVK